MSSGEFPLVSVLTPVYNGAEFIDVCIKSVLGQTYPNLEHIIVNNCSKDRTLEIAQSYLPKDSRLRVHDAEDFVGVIENHNRAFRMMSPNAKYCKIVSADDWIFPECLSEMVALAEQNPSIGMVGSYMLVGKQVVNTGLEYDKRVVNGRAICRATLLGGPYVFGTPSSLMYRADIVRESKAFYPNPNPHSDTTACYQALQNSDFGFVHQVLAGAVVHAETQTSRSIKYGTIRRALIADLMRFGPVYLTKEELDARVKHLMGYYYRWLIGAVVTNRRDPQFWPTQKAELEEVGLKLSYSDIGGAILLRGLDVLLEPRAALEKITKIARRDPNKIEAQYYE